jgi:hypothetical protein
MVASLATVRASAGDPPSPAAGDRPDAEMLLEVDLLADPRFDLGPDFRRIEARPASAGALM